MNIEEMTERMTNEENSESKFRANLLEKALDGCDKSLLELRQHCLERGVKKWVHKGLVIV